jgi:hypothetical protein
MTIENLNDGEIITISEYRQLYDDLVPGQNGEGYFIKNSTELTDDEVTNSKVFNSDYITENQYSHIAWYPK